jgi:hypothetical protein
VVQNFGKPPVTVTPLKAHEFRPPYLDTVPIPPPPEPVQQDTVPLTPEQLRAFQEQSFKEWGSPAASANPVTEMSVTAPAIMDEHDAVITPSAISYGQREETEEKEQVEPFVASSVLEALSKAETSPASWVVAETVVEPAPIVATELEPLPVTPVESSPAEAPAAFAPVAQAVPDVAADSAAQPFFAVNASDTATIPAMDFGPAAPVFMEAVTPELEAAAPVAEIPAFMGQVQDFEPNVAPPVEAAVEIVPQLEINSPPELRAEQVIVAQDPALVTDPDDLAGFTTKFGAPGADEIKVGLVSELSEEQLAAVTQSSPLPQEVTNEIAAVLGWSSVPQVFDGSNAEAHVFEEDSTPEASGVSEEAVVAVPAVDETAQLSPAVEQLTSSESIPAQQVAEMAAMTIETPPPVETQIIEVAAPELSVVDADAPESALSAIAGMGSITDTGYFSSAYKTESHEIEPQLAVTEERVAASAETGTTSYTEMESIPVEPAGGQQFGDPQLAEQLAAALLTKAADDQAVGNEVAGAVEQQSESKEPGATDLRLSDAVAKAFERLKPQLITEIMKELRK